MRRQMEEQGKAPAKKVLVVDDDDATRELITAALTWEGYEAIGVNDVPAAMQAIEQMKPDLLITDIRLDAYNGLQLLAMAPAAIPAIVLTGFADPVIEAEARGLGAEYLIKPISPSALCKIVARKIAAAAQNGTFICARRWPRRWLRPPVPVRIGNATGRLVDVSDGGARMHVDTIVGAGLPSTLSLAVTSSQTAIPLGIVWKRRVSDTMWECGASVSEDMRNLWVSALEKIIRPGPGPQAAGGS